MKTALVDAMNNFSSFIIDPHSEKRSNIAKGFAWATTTIFAVGTLGIVPGLCALWRHFHPVGKNDTHEKIKDVFQKIFSTNPQQNPTDAQPQPENDPVNAQHVNDPVNAQNINVPPSAQPVHAQHVNEPLPKPHQLSEKELAQNIYDRREKLWEKATTKAGKSPNFEQIMNQFVFLIRKKFRDNNSSLSAINDPEALKILFKSSILRPAVLKYAEANQLESLKQQHLVYVAQNIYEKRDDYTAKAIQVLRDKHIPVTDKNILIALTEVISKEFKQEGRSLEEVFYDREVVELFKKSSRLQLVLVLYDKFKAAPPQHSPQQPSSEAAPFDRKKEARDLGMAHAQGQGYVTMLNLQEYRSDEVQLQRAVKQYLLRNHPDKNPDADPVLQRAATDLKDMLGGGNYQEYQGVMNALRGQR